MGLPQYSDVKRSDREYELIANFIYETCGINLGDNKRELVKARLMKRIRYHKFRTFREYYDFVIHEQSGEEVAQMLDSISTNVTSFFREDQHFDYMLKKALPEIVERKRKAHNTKLRLWSAACSSGEEVYTMLITLAESMKTMVGWDIKVLGTDISTKVLMAAHEGLYDFERIKTVPLHLQDKYFDREMVDGQIMFRVKDQLRSMATFRRLNLMREAFPFQNKFDIIFCRNVMIYFDKPTQHKLLTKLHHCLDVGGYLFIGHSESLIGTNLKFTTVAPAAFKKTQ